MLCKERIKIRLEETQLIFLFSNLVFAGFGERVKFIFQLLNMCFNGKLHHAVPFVEYCVGDAAEFAVVNLLYKGNAE